jgi:LysR family transcriptional regulator of abg operon
MVLTATGRFPKENFSLESLLQENWLVLDPGGDPGSYVSALFSSANLPSPAKKIYCSSIVLYLQLATRIDLIVHWSESASEQLEDYFSKGTLKRLELPQALPEVTVFLGYQDENLLTPVAQEFVALLHGEVLRLRKVHRAK